MTDARSALVDAAAAVRSVEVSTARSAPGAAEATGYAVASKGSVPRGLGLNRAALEASGFEGKAGQVLAVPGADGLGVAIGIGDPGEIDANGLRRAAASFARAASTAAHLATNLADVASVAPEMAGRAVAEGILLASYRYVGLKTGDDLASRLQSATLIAGAKRAKGVAAGAGHGKVVAAAGALARELANTPPTHLNARDLAALAQEMGADSDVDVEVFNADDLRTMGCGGLLGVNRGSTEPPRMIKLTYSPKKPKAHLVLVGKGIMYDSGGISLKNSDAFHQVMKMDMSGAAAVFATMFGLPDLRGRNKVTAYLMCTDNMPSGSALKLGDVLTMRNGKTVEIHNTDAEGRLVLADGLSLASEEKPDGIVDIATLTGAALGALGLEIAAVLSNDDTFCDAVTNASADVDEPVWRLPLETERYRKLLDSTSADMRNIGGPYAGTITASIFLSEFVDGVPWAHLDIAGPMKVDADSGLNSKGATGFGTRLLLELATTYVPPED